MHATIQAERETQIMLDVRRARQLHCSHHEGHASHPRLALDEELAVLSHIGVKA